MKIYFFGAGIILALFSISALANFSAPTYKPNPIVSINHVPLIDEDTILSAPDKLSLTNLVCSDWVNFQPQPPPTAPWDTRIIISTQHTFTDTYIKCAFTYEQTNDWCGYNGITHHTCSRNVFQVDVTQSSGGYSYFIPPTRCELIGLDDTFDTYLPVGTVGDINILQIPFITCSNSCTYNLDSSPSSIKFAVTEEVASQFGCVNQDISNCGDLAPLLARFSYNNTGFDCNDTDSDVVQSEFLTSEAYNDPCENGPNEFDANCSSSGTFTSVPLGNNQTLEELLSSTSNASIALLEDVDSTTDGWTLLNGTIDNGINQFSPGDSSTNYSGDFITEINNYYNTGGGSGSGGDTNVTVDNSGVISAVNSASISINENIDITNTKLDDIINFNSQGMSDLADGTTLIDNDPNFIERSSKITDISSGSLQPFGIGWEGVFPTFTGTGECPNIDFTIREINLNLTTEFFCKSIELITITLDFMFFFFTIFQVFNLWRSALTEVI